MYVCQMLTTRNILGATTASSSSAQTGTRTSPIIISHPIKFSGNKLVHLPPQIIHVSCHFMSFFSGCSDICIGTPVGIVAESSFHSALFVGSLYLVTGRILSQKMVCFD